MSGVVFLDLKKAFDTVDHDILRCKLSSLGLSNSSIAWFENYLLGRTQVTKIGNHLSDPGHVSCGVPQGSILGPLLFILYINSLPNVIDNCETFLYANDTAIISTGSTEAEITDKLNNAMHSASTWLDDNKLSLNIGKTKCMFIGTGSKLSKAKFQDIKCKGEVIGMIESFKYLGVILDNTLRFDKHTSYIKKKVFLKMKMLGLIRSFISESLALQLYKSLIMPHIDYDDVIYDAANKKDCQTLQVIQNGCLRICCKVDPKTPVLDLHRRTKIPFLSDRRAAHSCNIIFNGIHGNSTEGINKMFTYVHDTHNVNTCTSSDDIIKLPKYRLSKSQNNLCYRGVQYFNRLPQNIRGSESLTSFKRSMKLEILK